MKKKLWLLIILGVIGIMGCSQQSEGTEGLTVTIAPYGLTENERKILNLSATVSGDILVYKVDSRNVNINAKIDHYRNGTLVNTIATLFGETTDKGELISFGSRTISRENEDFREWFITTQDATLRGLEEIEQEGMYSMASISDRKTISQDEYSVVGVLVHNRQKESISMSSLEDNHDLETVLQENEDVYVFSCKLE